MDYFCTLEPDKYYHIYNRTNHGIPLFYKPENYDYFLRKYDEYMSTYFETFAFCLLKNHFHFLVRIKTEEENKLAKCNPNERIGSSNKLIEPKEAIFKKTINYEQKISEMFRRFFTGYSKAINKQQKFSGNLLNHRFKRKQIDNTEYFKNLVFYIHSNPELHKLTDDFRQYPWSSYRKMLNDEPIKFYKKEILEWFEGKDNFINYHNVKHDFIQLDEFIIED
jgi:putative transposase